MRRPSFIDSHFLHIYGFLLCILQTSVSSEENIWLVFFYYVLTLVMYTIMKVAWYGINHDNFAALGRIDNMKTHGILELYCSQDFFYQLVTTVWICLF